MKKINSLTELKQRAIFGQIPIIHEDALLSIIKTLKHQQSSHLLELGSGIGYSAAAIASAISSITITSIELDENRCLDARENIALLGLRDRVTFIHADVRTFEGYQSIPYDALFIDASKSQQAALFERYTQFEARLKLVMIDNLNLHSVDRYVAHSRNARALKRKTAAFVETLMSHPVWQCQSHDVGDGIAICRRHPEGIR